MSASFLLACPVCFGAPGHQTSEAIGWAMLLLLGVLLPVLGGFLTFILYLARQSRRAAAMADFPSTSQPR